MEKFSKFNDPFTGINPFIAPKYRKITARCVLLALIRLPIFVLWMLGIPCISALISIRIRSKIKPSGLVYANAASFFDKAVIKAVYGSTHIRVVFPEETRTNNRAVLQHSASKKSSYAIGLTYSPECVYLYGNKAAWLIRFLGGENTVSVNCESGTDISQASGLPRVQLTVFDKIRFNSEYKKKQ
ncbi:hypothetical protein ENBRE01_0365 [Enteropsectra breve]|nr:hypothetical protein ENBRE01_0365 [Enteropsectra breve]